MLYITRKIGQKIIINQTIECTIVEIKGNSVKLGFESSVDTTIMRKEVHDKIIKQNLLAQQSFEINMSSLETEEEKSS